MLRSVNEMTGYRLHATDGDFGFCKDLLFDDRWWTVRHILADTGKWMIGRQVLVSPLMILEADWQQQALYLTVSKETLKNCPVPAEDETVSREHEKMIHHYYGHPYYWVGSGLWGPGASPAAVLADVPVPASAPDITGEDRENHLRSFKEVKGYDISARDGNIGQVEDFILEDETWALRYVVVDTRKWLPGGKKVILSLEWAESVSWSERHFKIDLDRDEIRDGPEFDPERPVNVEYEEHLFDYYGRPVERSIGKDAQQKIAKPFT